MGLAEDAVEILKNINGVVDAFLMDDELSARILQEELSVRSATMMDVENVAYDEVMKRDYRVCIIHDNDDYINERDHASVQMVNSSGVLIGTEVMENEMDQYIDRTDVIWISSDFIIFRDVPTDGTEKFIIPASNFPALNRLDDYEDAVSASPATTSDMILRTTHNRSPGRKTSTSVIGFNLSKKHLS